MFQAQQGPLGFRSFDPKPFKAISMITGLQGGAPLVMSRVIRTRKDPKLGYKSLKQ